MTATNDGYYEVFWPRAPRQTKKKKLAPRPASLEGKTIAQLWDFIFKGDKIFEIFEQELPKRYPGVKWVSWREFGNTHGQDERQILADLPRRLKEMGVDAAISGMGC